MSEKRSGNRYAFATQRYKGRGNFWLAFNVIQYTKNGNNKS